MALPRGEYDCVSTSPRAERQVSRLSGGCPALGPSRGVVSGESERETRDGGGPLFPQTAAKPRFGGKVVRRRSESNARERRSKLTSTERPNRGCEAATVGREVDVCFERSE